MKLEYLKNDILIAW